MSKRLFFPVEVEKFSREKFDSFTGEKYGGPHKKSMLADEAFKQLYEHVENADNKSCIVLFYKVFNSPV